MKTPAPAQNGSAVPSLFQITTRLEDFVPSVGLKKIAPKPDQTPFVDLVLHPDRLEAALINARDQNDAFDASRTISHNDANRPARNLPPKLVTFGKNGDNSPSQLKNVAFSLKVPSAKSVKLAADFTDWEKCALDLMQNEDGVWFSFIPLEPGQYSYRFIVDGQWCDDPRSTQRVPNPFGTENALLVVT